MTRTRIVIAEDEAIIRMDLAEMLEEEGFEVLGQAADGDAAIELVREFKPDLAILDIKMPKMNGIQVAEIISRERLAAVLMLTAFSQRDLAAQAAQAGALAYLVKPFQKADLIPAIEVALALFDEHSRLKASATQNADKLAERKIVERAKGKLIDSGLTESDAYRFMQKTAMDKHVTIKEVADKILSQPPEITDKPNP